MWIYMSTPPYAYLVKHRDNFNFTVSIYKPRYIVNYLLCRIFTDFTAVYRCIGARRIGYIRRQIFNQYNGSDGEV
jgi:hypothetical protein